MVSKRGVLCVGDYKDGFSCQSEKDLFDAIRAYSNNPPSYIDNNTPAGKFLEKELLKSRSGNNEDVTDAVISRVEKSLHDGKHPHGVEISLGYDVKVGGNRVHLTGTPYLKKIIDIEKKPNNAYVLKIV